MAFYGLTTEYPVSNFLNALSWKSAVHCAEPEQLSKFPPNIRQSYFKVS